MSPVRLENFEIPFSALPQGFDGEPASLVPFAAEFLKRPPAEISSVEILRRGIDARSRRNLKLIYNLKVSFSGEPPETESGRPSYPDTPETPNLSPRRLNPVVIGTGPAGLFAALLLAVRGAKPLIFERGRDVGRRKNDLDEFHRTFEVNPESNYLFGEGGAGTYSDGKLYTRTRDPRAGFILGTLADCGVSQGALTLSHPHIGSDILPSVVSKIREKIIAAGGVFHWDSKFVRADIQGGVCRGVFLERDGFVPAPALVLALGHSARPEAAGLAAAGVRFEMKSFQLGVRVEHPQSWVNVSRCGMESPPAFLGAAEYALALPGGQDSSGASSFCMCPGGEIIAAVTAAGRLSTNGMSLSARNGFFANSAIVASADGRVFGGPAEAFGFIESLEKAAYDAGGGSFAAPCQSAAAFLRGEKTAGRAESSYRPGVRPERIDALLPPETRDRIRRALKLFDTKMPEFIKLGNFVGVETRVSSPVRFTRHPESMESSVSGLFTAGEFGGHAGGIISAAVDGLKVAEAVLRGLSR